MAGQTNGSVDRHLEFVVQVSSAVSLGTLAGVLYSVKSVTPSVQFSFTAATLLAFSLAALGSIAFWHVVFKLSGSENKLRQADRRSRTWLAFLATVLGVALIFAFIYPLRDFSHDKVSEIGYGAGVAVGFLVLLALLFWRVVRFLEKG